MSVQEMGAHKERCPYDPQQMEFPKVIKKLIDAVTTARSASHSLNAYLDLLYWQGVAVARDAHIHPPCQSGTRVKRKPGTRAVMWNNEFLRPGPIIDDDNERVVIRVIGVVTGDGNIVWCLQLEGNPKGIFPEDQFDVVSCGTN